MAGPAPNAVSRLLLSRAARAALGLALGAMPAPAQRSDTTASAALPAFDWAPIYFESFDAAARAAGLTPLRDVRLAVGTREVRVWTQVEIGIPKHFYRFVDRSGQVSGELIFHWPADPADTASGERPGETMHDLMLYTLQGKCDRFSVHGEAGVCRGRFRRTPAWASVLRAAEAQGLWTIPDPSTFPEEKFVVFDGWTIVVELLDARGYRTYRYNSPEAHPSWPTAARVREIARLVGTVDETLAPSERRRAYRGLTTGMPGAAFRPCGSDTTWEFGGDLRAMVREAPASRRAAFVAALDTTRTDATYLVEVRAEPTPEWLARQWGSRFVRVLQVDALLALRRWMAPDCQ